MLQTVTSHATGKWKMSSVPRRTEMTIPEDVPEATDAEKMQRVLSLSDSSSAWEHYQAYMDAGMTAQAAEWAWPATIERLRRDMP